MIGNMSGPFAGAIGEGMSDVLAIYFNGDDRLAEYSYNNPIGIRRNPYTNYPRTYGDVTGTSVHNDGEIYAAALWRLRELWLNNVDEGDEPAAQERLLTFIVKGMNETPSRPQYEDMRDGILAAMSLGGGTTAESCRVWQAFADFGIGQGADGRETCRGLRCTISITESFAVPSSCTGSGGNTAPVVTISAPANNSSFTQGASITFNGSASDTQDGSLSASLVWSSSINGTIGAGASFSTTALSVGTHTVTASVTDSGSLSGQASITVTVTSASGFTLTATTTKVKGVNHANLAWSGATGQNVDIRRNGSFLRSTANDGTEQDNTNTKGGQTFTYQICEAGSTSVCSNTVTVVF
jgi:hypothetical protein